MKAIRFLSLAMVLAYTSYAQPVINSFSPATGSVGTVVTIQGTGFSNTTSNNLVCFGGIHASVLTATATTLTVKVPAGATCKPITVTSGGLAAQSSATFVITFPGGGSPFSSNAFVPAGSVYVNMSGLVSGTSDLNGDGKTDLFIAGGFTQGLMVFVNNTQGHSVTFGQTLAIDLISTSQSAATAADLDGDGKPDLIIGNSAQVYGLSLFRNTSSGVTVSFAPHVDLPANDFPTDIAVGDMDGDGKPDIIVSDGPGHVISFFRNNSIPGTLSFESRMDIDPGYTPGSIAISDLDGDGKADLALSTFYGIGVMRNISVGNTFTFAPLISCSSGGGHIVSVKAGDLDGDRMPELVATDLNGNSITIIQNKSTPGNISFAAAQSISCFNNTNHVDVDDMDGDGKLDLVSSNINFPNVSVFRNTGNGTAIGFDAPSDYWMGSTSFAYSTVADMDANGRPDIVIGSSGFLIYNNMIGAAPVTIDSFQPTQGITGTVVTIRGKNFTTTTEVMFGDSAAASFNVVSDSVITAIVGGGSSGDLTVNNADAKATALSRFFFNPTLLRDFYPTVADSGSPITIYGSNFANIQDVLFGNVSAQSFTVDSLGGITAIVGAGRSGDITIISPNGRADIAGFSFSPPVITSFFPTSGEVGSVVTILGKNFNTDTSLNMVRFGAVNARVIHAAATEIQAIVPSGANYQPISVVTDSRRIAFASKPFVNTFSSDDPVIKATSFVPAGDFATYSDPTDLAVGDLDDDGRPDMVALEKPPYNFAVFLNRSSMGNIKFEQRIDFSSSPDPVRILLQDMNGDGKSDVVILHDGPITGNYSPSQIKVLTNGFSPNVAGFSGTATIYTTNGTRGICIADMNGDGLPDIIVSNGNTGTISIFPNTTWFGQTIPTFGDPIDYTGSGHPDFMIAVDRDQDGRPDIIATNGNNQSITFYRNISQGGKFALASGIDVPTAASSPYITAGDLDGDGLPDLISGQNANGSGIADLNGDGKADLGFGRNDPGGISIWQNNYTGSGPLTFTPTTDIPVGIGDHLYYVNDLDGDSKPDLMIANTSQGTISVFRNTIGDPVIETISVDTVYKGTEVKLSGRNFRRVNQVLFGGISADSFRTDSQSDLSAVVGPGASGKVTVQTSTGIGNKSGVIFMPQIIPEGDTIFCWGNSARLHSTAAYNNQWYKNGVVISNDTAVVADTSAVYTVATTSENITTISSTQHVIAIVVPMPVITPPGQTDSLMSSAEYGNQWYFDNSSTAFDTTRTIYLQQPGEYFVTVTQDGCTSSPSEPYYWGGSQAIQFPDDQYITYYPNPVKNWLYVTQHTNGQPLTLDLTFYDEKGNTWLSVQRTLGGYIDISKIPMGNIFMRIHADGIMKVDKTVRILKVQ